MNRLALFTAMLAFSVTSHAQFQGTLTYDCMDKKTETMMTVYLTPGKARIETKIYPLKNGIADIPRGKEQDVLIYDFATNKQVDLDLRRKTKSESETEQISQEHKMKLTEEDIKVEDKGMEKVNTFNCQHLVIHIKGKTQELWITKDFGGSNFYVGTPETFYPTGSLVLSKIKSAGFDGVVVKAQADDQTTELTAHSAKEIAESTFDIPAGFRKG